MPQVDYCASKFACVGLDEALRVETLVQVIYSVCFLCVLFSHFVLFSLFVCLFALVLRRPSGSKTMLLPLIVIDVSNIGDDAKIPQLLTLDDT